MDAFNTQRSLHQSLTLVKKHFSNSNFFAINTINIYLQIPDEGGCYDLP
jgi:hypothetical protein